MNKNQKQPEIKPSPAPNTPSSIPEIAPRPDKNMPEQPLPEIIPSHNPEIRPQKNKLK